jgi:hypothetical protein
LRIGLVFTPMESFVKASRSAFSRGGIWVEGQGGTHEGQRGVASLRLSPDSRQ